MTTQVDDNPRPETGQHYPCLGDECGFCEDDWFKVNEWKLREASRCQVCGHLKEKHQRWLKTTFPGLRADRWTDCLEDECYDFDHQYEGAKSEAISR